jgi:hypothetical protein
MFDVEAKSGTVYVKAQYEGKLGYAVSEIDAVIKTLKDAKEEAERQIRLQNQRRADFEANLKDVRAFYDAGRSVDAIKALRSAWASKDENQQPLDLWTAKVLVERLCYSK